LARAHPGLLTLIVPRHPERAAAFGPAARRSREPPPAGGVYVADTLGELGLFYRLAGLAFIGGSLIPHGGQNPLEAARLGCAIAIGPYAANFEEAVAALAQAGAIARVADATALAGWVDALLRAPARRAALGEAAAAAASRWEDLPAQVARVLLDAMAHER
jgi:3-deoxy-D-manno-octulosonic-acid transferase